MNLFGSLFKPNHHQIYIDLGTANTIVMDNHRGLLADEPSVIAYRELANGKRQILAVGSDAKRKIGRTPGNVVASRPLKDGVVADLDATEAMLKYFMGFSKASARWRRPGLVVSLPFGVSDVEKKAVRDCGLAGGAREVSLIEEPMAAAIGAGLPIEAPHGSMIIDIGGGTTEIAVISLYGIVHCEAVRVGGHAFDTAITDFIRRRYNLIVGEQSAERLKIEIGSAVPDAEVRQTTIRGLDFVTGLPRQVTITSTEVFEAISGLLEDISAAARRTLENTPPELLSDIVDTGVWIAGGGALLRDIDRRLSRELGLNVRLAADPLRAIANGGARSIKDPYLLSRILLS